jgi:hypothetical protein
MESIIQQQTNNSGSNYCKMPDGTLIQYGVIEINDLEPNTNELLRIDYSIQFSGSSKVFISPVYYGSPDSVFSLVLQQFETYSSARVRHISSTNISLKLNWIAIGRWK